MVQDHFGLIEFGYRDQPSMHCNGVVPVSARFHGPTNASGTGTGSGKMGSMLEIEQYYTVRVRDQIWDRIRDREVGVPDPVPDAMGPRPIASGNCVRVILYSICNPKSQNRSWKHFSDHVKPPTSLILDPDPDPDCGNEHLLVLIAF